MSSQRRGGLVAAMKNISLEELQVPEMEINNTEPTIDPEVGEPNPTQPETVEIEFPEASESPEAQELEVERAEAEVDAIEEAIDDATDVIEQVEQISEIVERGNENGGLDQTGAELLSVTLESLYARVGMTKAEGERFVPSIESFGGTGSRIRAGNIALEDMAQRVKTIWENIIKTIKVWIQKGIQLAKEMFVQTDRLKARSAKLREIASKVPNQARNSGIENDRIANALAVGNSVPANIVAEIENLAKIGEKIAGGVSAMTTEIGKKYLGLLKLAGNLDAKLFQEKSKEFIETHGSLQQNNNIFTEPLEDDAFDAKLGSSVIPGNKRFVLGLSGITGTDLEKLKVKFAVEDIEQEVAPSLKVLNKQELASLFKAVDAIIESIEKIKSQTKMKAGVKEQMLQAAASLITAEEKAGEDPEAKAMFATIRKTLQASLDTMDAMDKQYIRQALRVSGAALNYAQVCLKEYAPEKQEATDAEPATA